MRLLVAFFCAVFALAAIPPSARAELGPSDPGLSEPHLVWGGGALLLGGALEPGPGHEWAEWSDVDWMLWLVQAEPRVEPEPAWPAPPPPALPANGSWLRLEADAGGVSVIPMEPPRYAPAEEEELQKRRVRIAVGVAVPLALLAVGITVGAIAASIQFD